MLREQNLSVNKSHRNFLADGGEIVCNIPSSFEGPIHKRMTQCGVIAIAERNGPASSVTESNFLARDLLCWQEGWPIAKLIKIQTVASIQKAITAIGVYQELVSSQTARRPVSGQIAGPNSDFVSIATLLQALCRHHMSTSFEV